MSIFAKLIEKWKALFSKKTNQNVESVKVETEATPTSEPKNVRVLIQSSNNESRSRANPLEFQDEINNELWWNNQGG